MNKKIIYTKGEKVGDCIFICEVKSDIDSGGQHRRKASFLCECGNEFISNIDHIKSRVTRSCGCIQKEAISNLNKTHGCAGKKRKLSGYSCWSNMIDRCSDQNRRNYGANGVVVCDRWRKSFENFIEDMGLRPTLKHSIDRYPNKKGNYEPSNCRWATRREQANNTKKNIIVNFDGENKTLPEWCYYYGINYHSAYQRYIVFGWSMADVVIRGIQNRLGQRIHLGLSGAANPNSKLSLEQVIEVKRRYKEEKITQVELARIYGVSQAHIGYIVNNRVWKQLSSQNV